MTLGYDSIQPEVHVFILVSATEHFSDLLCIDHSPTLRWTTYLPSIAVA